MNLIDADGKFGDPFSLTFYAASAVALGVGITIAATYQATRTSYKNYGRMPTQLEVELTATKMLLDVGNEVSSWFNSKETDDAQSVSEQADKISKKIGKNSVTLPDGTRVDLKGRGHRNEQGEKIETPHTHDVEINTNPKTGKTFIKTRKVPRPTTQEDLDKVKERIKNQKE